MDQSASQFTLKSSECYDTERVRSAGVEQRELSTAADLVRQQPPVVVWTVLHHVDRAAGG